MVRDVESSLREVLPVCHIEHIGATSMPDGVTKGDIDVNVRVSAEDFSQAVQALRSIFPVAQPANWTSTYASFSDPHRALPVGLQVTVLGWTDDFLVPLRDLMRTNPALRREYDRCKRESAPLGPDGYWAAKNSFLTRILADYFPGTRRTP